MATHAPSLDERRSRRIRLVVMLCAAVAAGLVVGVTLFEMRGQTTSVPGAVTSPRSGPPPIQLEFSLGESSESRALAHAEQLLNHGKAAQAATIFRHYHSLDARLGLIFATWQGESSLPAVKKLAAAHPNDPGLLLNLGWADFQAGRNADAVAAWQKVARRFPDTPYGVDAQDPLHSSHWVPGLPIIVTGLAPPSSIGSLPLARQLAVLKRDAAASDPRAKIVYGSALWNLKRPLSAERQFVAAAKLAPHDPLAQTLAAVGRFSKAHPVRAFGHLGPLTAVFPKSPVVEFHLGVLLLWIDDQKKAVEHLQLAVADGPHSVYANAAKQLLASLTHK